MTLTQRSQSWGGNKHSNITKELQGTSDKHQQLKPTSDVKLQENSEFFFLRSTRLF